MDDHLSRKPKGVSKSNGSKAMEKLLSCKQYTNVETMNVRTVKNKSKQQELSYNCEKQSINILGVIDHKITHQEEIRYESVDRHTLITSSAWRSSNGAAVGGVGLMLNHLAENALSEVIPWSKRL